MSSSTELGYPYPVGTDTTDIPADLEALASAVDAAPGIPRLTQTQINALTTAEKRAGRIVYNTTTGKHQKSDGSTFSDLGGATYVADAQPSTMNVGDLWVDSSASI